MTKLNQIYKCELCGNIVEVVCEGGGSLKCCETEMKLLNENSVDAAKEKHVPEYKVEDGVCKVVVGSTAHPMGTDHLIEWIQVIDGKKVMRKCLSATDEPKAEFCVKNDNPVVRAYCNLHGLWKA